MNSTNYLYSLTFAISLLASPLLAANDKPVNWQELPPPMQTPSVGNAAEVVSKPAGAVLTLPKGFRLEEYASGMQAPRYLLQAPNDIVLVSDMEAGKVYALFKQQKTEILKGLTVPYGLALWKDWLYVAEVNSVKRYKYDAARHAVTTPGQEIVSLKRFQSGHPTRTLLLDDSTEKLYLSIGSASNVNTGEDPMRAAINRFNMDGSGHEIFASGIRNAVGLRWYPGTHTLWATTHERDALGDDLPPDFLTEVQQGGFYGWPYAYIGPHEDPRHAGKAPEQVAKTLYPNVLLGGHVGAMDFIFYQGTQFPAEYRGGCFLAEHGSWNRSRLAGYKVVFIPFKNGKPTAGPRDFISGWAQFPEVAKVWGRPVGLLELADGSLLLSDDGAGKIWHIRYHPD